MEIFGENSIISKDGKLWPIEGCLQHDEIMACSTKRAIVVTQPEIKVIIWNVTKVLS